MVAEGGPVTGGEDQTDSSEDDSLNSGASTDAPDEASEVTQGEPTLNDDRFEACSGPSDPIDTLPDTDSETAEAAEPEAGAEGATQADPAVAEATNPDAELAVADPAEAAPAEAEPAEAEPAEGNPLEAGDDDATADAEYRRRLREYTRELKKLPGSWYIIQSYSGYENKVKTNLDMRIQTLEVEDSIYDVVVPIEEVVELKDGKRKIVKRKLLPGYVLVRMDINDAAWSVVRETPGVTSFVGNEGNATPVKHKDVAKFLMPKTAPVEGEKAPATSPEGETVIAMPEEEAKPKVAHDFQVGEAVTILSGALASVSATINEIDPETGRIQALVSIFGRETPVELTADQIERII
ncbi:transcription termination/antitermination protein NusG [Corynebacterium aquatimens]